MDEPKAFVLMNKETGDLLEGYRILLYDKEESIYPVAWTEGQGNRVKLICTSEHDGWIVYRPDVSPFAWFFNRESEKFFEVLGEL